MQMKNCLALTATHTLLLMLYASQRFIRFFFFFLVSYDVVGAPLPVHSRLFKKTSWILNKLHTKLYTWLQLSSNANETDLKTEEIYNCYIVARFLYHFLVVQRGHDDEQPKRCMRNIKRLTKHGRKKKCSKQISIVPQNNEV